MLNLQSQGHWFNSWLCHYQVVLGIYEPSRYITNTKIN